MNKAKRQAVIAGNWKMNKTRPEAKALIEELKPLVKDADCGVVICVPYTNLETALEATRGSSIKVGAENCHWAKSGAFTGEISADMLAEMGVEYVVIGHSERRQYFGETDKTVNQRVRAALDAGLKVILCVGELLEQREQGITEEICAMQTKVALGGVSKEELSRIIIAYEPVWAIGTGKTATADQADEVNGFIRSAGSGPLRQRCCRSNDDPVRRLHEREKRRRAAEQRACGRRPYRRCIFESRGFLYYRKGCFQITIPHHRKGNPYEKTFGIDYFGRIWQ